MFECFIKPFNIMLLIEQPSIFRNPTCSWEILTFWSLASIILCRTLTICGRTDIGL
uniref:Uncharacterized protein n=1 Tax=Lepeophtheirus salmonis TaxID=72036 RepID=A0A0K2UI92_LEPSM